jgi:hypothetical protein
MPGVGDLVANLSLNSAGFSKGLGEAKGSLGSFAGGIAKSLGPIAGALAAAWGGAESVSGYKTQLQAERKLAAVLETTGHAAGLTADEMKKLAGDLRNVTNFSDEATIESMALLATFKEIKGDVFGDATAAIQDMASVMGTDLKGATIQVGKALNNPIVGMSALADAGVSFTEAQKLQIKTMQEAGDVAGAQGVILAELSGEFGGTAKAMADPWTQAKNAIGDVGEVIGSLLLPSIDVVSRGITAAAGWLSSFGDMFLTVGTEAAAWMTILGEAWFVFAESIWAAIEPALSNVAGMFDWLFGEVLGNGNTSFQEMGIEAVVVMTNITGIIQVAAMEWGLAIVEFANDTMFMFTDQLPAVVSWFADNWTDVLFTAVDYTLTIFINLGQNIRNMWSAVLEFIKGNGFNFDWTPLTEGAASAISKLPDIPERVATEFETSMKADIAGLTEGLGNSMEAQRKELTAGLVKSREEMTAAYSPTKNIPGAPEPGSNVASGGATGASGKEVKSAGAQMAGSAEAYSTIAAAFLNKGKDKTVDAIEKQTGKLIASNEKTRGAAPVVVESFS